MNQNVIIINWSVALCMTNGNSSKPPAYRQNTYNLPVESISHEKNEPNEKEFSEPKKDVQICMSFVEKRTWNYGKKMWIVLIRHG